jgi:DNA-binding Lrp family transcriptional regulator
MSALLDAIHTMLGRRLSVYAERRRNAIAAHHGLSTCNLRVLEQIVELGPLTTGQLTRVSGLSAGSITTIVDRLEASGMIRRTTHPIDRRIILLDADMQRYGALQAHGGTRLPKPDGQVHVTPQSLTQVHAFLSHYLGDRRDGALLDGGDQHAI